MYDRAVNWGFVEGSFSTCAIDFGNRGILCDGSAGGLAVSDADAGRADDTIGNGIRPVGKCGTEARTGPEGRGRGALAETARTGDAGFEAFFSSGRTGGPITPLACNGGVLCTAPLLDTDDGPLGQLGLGLPAGVLCGRVSGVRPNRERGRSMVPEEDEDGKADAWAYDIGAKTLGPPEVLGAGFVLAALPSTPRAVSASG